MTIGVQLNVILPCASAYNSGLLTRFEIMSTTNQLWVFVALFTSSSMFSLLLGINRAFAVSMKLSDRTKKILLKSFFLQLFLQFIGTAIVGLRLKDNGESGRTACIEMIKEYPIEMDTLHGVNFMFTNNIEFIIAMVFICTYAVFYLSVASICGVVLYISIRDQGKSTQSAQFLANQRRISVGIIYYGVVELVGVGVPVVMLGLGFVLNIGNYVVSLFSLILPCFYPIAGPYYVLMSNVDYNKRVKEIIANVRSKLCSSRANQKVTSVSSVLFGSTTS